MALLGIDAGQVSDVILTHLHYDHAGNYGLSPNATFHVQDREIAYAVGRYTRRRFGRLLFAERVACCGDNACAVVPGITVHRLGGHTAGLQAVRIEIPFGATVLAPDASPCLCQL